MMHACGKAGLQWLDMYALQHLDKLIGHDESLSVWTGGTVSQNQGESEGMLQHKQPEPELSR